MRRRCRGQRGGGAACSPAPCCAHGLASRGSAKSAVTPCGTAVSVGPSALPSPCCAQRRGPRRHRCPSFLKPRRHPSCLRPACGRGGARSEQSRLLRTTALQQPMDVDQPRTVKLCRARARAPSEIRSKHAHAHGRRREITAAYMHIMVYSLLALLIEYPYLSRSSALGSYLSIILIPRPQLLPQLG
eukprot:scaffold17394_cov114-Isochrysis_galbana.AAC.4